MRLDGRVAIVTGAASGIGRSIARELASEGASVAAVDVNPLVKTVCSVIENTGGKVKPYVFDITDQPAYRQCVEEVAAENGVPLMENKPLAQALFREVEIGDTIPEKFYDAISIILAEVYKLTGKVPAEATG